MLNTTKKNKIKAEENNWKPIILYPVKEKDVS
jgi:hypothetical protein